MPKVRELSDCPLCFGRLMPLSVCHSCNSVMVRDGLDEVGAQIVCEDCGATNPTHFVCSACNARFPYAEIVKPEGPTCPVCRNPVPHGAELCPHCSAVLPLAGATGARRKRRIRGEFTEEDVREVGRIPGVGRARADALCKAGYNALWKIARATEAELARVKGIGPKVATEIKEALRFLLLIGRQKTKEEVLSDEYECPLCGTVTSLFATTCHGCGAAFDEEELEEDFRKEIDQEEEKALLAYYDVRMLEAPDSAALHLARALLLIAMGRGPDALASLDRALEIEPANARVLQAKTRALASAKGIGSAAQVLREIVATARFPEAAPTPTTPETEAEALRALADLEGVDCPECGEKQSPGAIVCPVCGHRFAPEEPPPPTPMGEGIEERLLEDLERAVAGEAKAPPPPLRPEVPETVVDRKRSMLAFLLAVPGVGRRAAEAVSGFFQDLDQIRLSEIADLADIPGVAPAEARLIKEAVEEHFGPEPEEALPAPAPVVPPPRPERPRPPAREEMTLEPRPEPAAKPAAPHPVPAAPRARVAEITAGRRGLINGRGLVNGRGRVNGLINGSGFVNGSSVAEPRLPKRNLLPRYVAIGASMIMLFTIASAVIPAGPPGGIHIDGKFDDWQGVLPYDFSESSSNANVAIQTVFLTEDRVQSSVLLRVRLPANAAIFGDQVAPDTLYTFLDSDGIAATGYAVSGMGADYLVQISGFGGAVQETRLSHFESSDPENWSAWKSIVTIPAAIGQEPNGGAWNLEAAISEELLGSTFKFDNLRAVFAFDDNRDNATHTDVPIDSRSGSLRVTQESLVTTWSSASQPFLRLTFEAFGGEVNVRSVSIEAAPGAVMGTPPQMPITVVPRTPQGLVWTIDASALPPSSVVSARVLSVDATGLYLGANVPAPYVVVNVPARAYVGSVPAGKRIDGLFSDWTGNKTSSTFARRDSLRIVSRNGTVAGNDAYLYVELGGAALEGWPQTQRLAIPQMTSGSGASGGAGTPPPRLVGYDYIRFYLRTNDSVATGVSVNGLLVDRYVEVRGRERQVTNASLYLWSGSSWRWEGPASWGLGNKEVEVSVVTPGAMITVTRLVAVTSDWRGVADVAGQMSTRSGTRGSGLLSPLQGGNDPTTADTAYAPPLSGAPTVDGDCSDSQYANAATFTNSDSNISGKAGTFASFVYICITTGDSTNDGSSDFARIYFDRDHGGSPLSAGDRRFAVVSGSGQVTPESKRGNNAGNGWDDCPLSGSPGPVECHSGNLAQGAYLTFEHYEFKVHYTDVWNTTTPSASQQAGFAVITWDNGTNHTWGSNVPPTDTNPNSWGVLEIPEFGSVALVATGTAVFLGLGIRIRKCRRGPRPSK